MVNFQKFQGTVTDKKILSPSVFEISIRLDQPSEIDFIAGQYATFIISPSVRRSYSIASVPWQKNTINLCVGHTAGGPGSLWIKEMKVGDQVEFLGPLGKFIVNKETVNQKIFIATGTGIAPFLSMIRDLLEKDLSKDSLKLFFGVRSEEDRIYFASFEDLAKKYPNFIFQPILSRPNSKVDGALSGHVDLLIDRLPNDELLNSEFYLCGRKEMINSVKEKLIGLKVLPGNIFMELF